MAHRFLLIYFYTAAIIFLPLCASTSPKCEDQKECDSCLGTPGCSWCKELFTKDNVKSQNPRCNTIQGHKANQCKDIEVTAESRQKITSDTPITNTMRIRPQRVDFSLGVGQQQSVELEYIDGTDKPLDLYYIMDLSATMSDDKETVSANAELLVKELRGITSNVRLGFGSFIDKPVLPFVSSSQLRGDKGAQESDYDIPYGFKNVLPLTEKSEKFAEKVRSAKISRNLDEPEGTFDALMQAITCTNEIGWRNNSRKLIVVATDGPFHIAGDGKLGGIVKPNDMKCHMDRNGEFYTHSKILDYPSIGEINAVILQHKVYVIFAISKLQGDRVSQLYKELEKHITQANAVDLDEKSSEMVQTIKRKYEEISKTVRLSIDKVPDHVKVQVDAQCPRKAYATNQNHCTDVTVKDKIKFKITVTLARCPDKKMNYKENNQIVISFFELTETERLVINLNYTCKCDCNKQRNMNPEILNTYCSGGAAALYESCGLCSCQKGRYGDTCQCSKTSDTDDDQEDTTKCENPDGRKVCSDRGSCKCGLCECHQGFNGKYCQDSTLTCQNPQGQQRYELCSGNGRCDQGKCKCSDPEKFDGKYCECEKKAKLSCVEPGKTEQCNGHGECNCAYNQAFCKCESGYSGPYCEVCKAVKNTCPSTDVRQTRCNDKYIKEGVKCRIINHDKPHECPSTSKKRVCSDQAKSKDGTRHDIDPSWITFFSKSQSADIEGTKCEVRLNDSCVSKFWYSYKSVQPCNMDELQVFYLTDDAEVICSTEPPIIWIMIGVLALVVFAGILALLIWKLATHLHDTREYKRFEKETKGARWEQSENPLYNKPTTEFENPAYRE